MSTQSLRHWAAGLIEAVSVVVDHLADGLQLLADTIDPEARTELDTDDEGRIVIESGDYIDHVPASEKGEHRPSDDCRCGVLFECINSPTGGDAWRRYHRPLEDK